MREYGILLTRILPYKDKIVQYFCIFYVLYNYYFDAIPDWIVKKVHVTRKYKRNEGNMTTNSPKCAHGLVT